MASSFHYSSSAAIRRLDGVTVRGIANCPHCGALLQGSICAICGKSMHEAVEVVDAPPPPSAWATDFDTRRLAVMGATIGVLLIVAAGAWFILSRPAAAPAPNALPPPSPTTIRVDVESPTVGRPEAPSDPIPAATIEVGQGAERTIGGGSSPWEAPVPIDILTGEPLADGDYQAGINEVARLLERGSSEFDFAAPTLLATASGVDFATAEADQPFGARGVSLDGIPVADLWLFAAPRGDEGPSSAYVAAATAQWPVEAATQQYSPQVGVRIHLVADDGLIAVWVSHLPNRLLVVWVESDASPATLAAIVGGLASN